MGNGTYTLPETTKAHLGAMLYSFREGTSLKIYFVWYHRGFFRTNHVSWLECSSCYGILSLKRSIIDPFCSPPSFQMMLDYTGKVTPTCCQAAQERAQKLLDKAIYFWAAFWLVDCPHKIVILDIQRGIASYIPRKLQHTPGAHFRQSPYPTMKGFP